MMENITLREYLDTEDKVEYDFLIKYVMPADVYNVGDFTELPFGIIKDLQYDVSEGLTWTQLIGYLSKILKKKERVIGSYKILDVAKFKSYMIAEIERIGLVERELLSYTPTTDEQQAGIDSFDKFGSYGQLRKLCGGDVTKMDAVNNIKYSLALRELYYLKTESDFQYSLSKIKYRTK